MLPRQINRLAAVEQVQNKCSGAAYYTLSIEMKEQGGVGKSGHFLLHPPPDTASVWNLPRSGQESHPRWAIQRHSCSTGWGRREQLNSSSTAQAKHVQQLSLRCSSHCSNPLSDGGLAQPRQQLGSLRGNFNMERSRLGGDRFCPLLCLRSIRQLISNVSQPLLEQPARPQAFPGNGALSLPMEGRDSFRPRADANGSEWSPQAQPDSPGLCSANQLQPNNK